MANPQTYCPNCNLGYVWLQIDTNDNNKIVGFASFSDPDQRSTFISGTLMPAPNSDTGIHVVLPPNVAGGGYRWNGSTVEPI